MTNTIDDNLRGAAEALAKVTELRARHPDAFKHTDVSLKIECWGGKASIRLSWVSQAPAQVDWLGIARALPPMKWKRTVSSDLTYWHWEASQDGFEFVLLQADPYPKEQVFDPFAPFPHDKRAASA